MTTTIQNNDPKIKHNRGSLECPCDGPATIVEPFREKIKSALFHHFSAQKNLFPALVLDTVNFKCDETKAGAG